jgi:CheY-like chemotaxis protein
MSARVLLVGPADKSSKELKVALEQAGFLTQTASDGIQALETGRQFQPHLVITETVLSGINGFELSSRIWNGAAGFSAQVVIYTQAYRDEKLRQDAISEYHALHYFVKPFQKESLLNTVVPYLYRTELVSKTATPQQTQVRAPSRKPRTDSAASPLTAKQALERAFWLSAGVVPGGSGAARRGQAVPAKERPQPIVKRSAKPESTARESDLLQKPHLSEDRFLSVTKSGVKKPLGLLESPPESQPTDLVPSPAETAVVSSVSPSSLSLPSRPSTGRDSAHKLESFSAETAFNAAVESQSPASSDPSLDFTQEVPVEPAAAMPSTQRFSKRTQLLAGAMAVVALSLALRSSSSNLHRLEVSRATSDLPAPTEDPSSFKREDLGAPPAPASMNEQEPGTAASEAVTRWLQGSKSNPSPRPQDLPARRPGQRSGNSSSLPSPSTELIISDISPMERQPFLTTMVRPSLSGTQIRAMGSKSFLVSLELDETGSVKKALLMTPDPEGAFPDHILETVRTWQFGPRDKPQQGAWVKYFSFKAPQTAH